MKKWAGYVATTIFVIVLLITCVGMYTTWRDCSAAGGTTVRGLFGLECINQLPHNAELSGGEAVRSKS